MQIKSKFYSLWSFLNGANTVLGLFCVVFGWWLFDNAWMSIAGMFMAIASTHSQELISIKSVKETTDWDQK